MRNGVTALREQLQPISDLEPMVADLDQRMRAIDPKIDEMRASIEPIGGLAEKIPGNRRRRG